MKINYNVSAMIANNELKQNEGILAKSLQRLSSGLKINNAKDNPSGLAIGKRMNAQIRGLDVATQNASDGISIIETADGALSEVTDMIQRMSELAIAGSNGTMSDSDRKALDDEVNQLKDEITRIADTTEFNGQTLLDGEFDLKGYTNDESIKISYYSDEVVPNKYTLASLEVTYDAEGNITGGVADFAQPNPLPAGTEWNESFGTDVYLKEIVDNKALFIGDSGFELEVDLNAFITDADTAGMAEDATATKTVEMLQLDLKGIGPMRLQIGANEGQVLELRIPEVSLSRLTVDRMDLSTKAGCEDAIDRANAALEQISSIRSRLGAYQNRLESLEESLDITYENITAAYSRIMDVDMAKEMTEYSTSQILNQSSTSMLAQANERPSQVLQLLQ